MTVPTRRRPLPAARRQDDRAQLRDSARRQRRDRTRRRVRRASFAALALVPVCLAAWLLLASPVLAVDRVEVTGTVRLTAEQVRAVAGVAGGTPLARVDSPAVRRRVGALPPVARVRVVRAWPHTLRIQITERAPVAGAQQPDGSWTLVDAHGVRFAPSAAAPPGLPELQGAAVSSPAAVQVLAELPAGLVSQVTAVQLPSPSSVLLLLQGGRALIWGPPGQATRKAAVVAALLPHPGATIDVTSPDVAVVH